MIRTGTRVTIVPSWELTGLKLNALLGETGVVLEDLTDSERRCKGYMVLFADVYKEEYVWFVPLNSVYEQD